MIITSPESNENLYFYKKNHIIRTGCLLYYDPLLCSDLYATSLSSLNIINDSLPIVDTASFIPSNNINVSIFTVNTPLRTPPNSYLLDPSIISGSSLPVIWAGKKTKIVSGSIIITPTLGTEEVINGTFSTTSNWTTSASWTISGSLLHANSPAIYTRTIQGNATTAGIWYQYQFDLINYSTGSISLQDGSAWFFNLQKGDGTKIKTYRPTNTTIGIGVATGATITDVDNMSIKAINMSSAMALSEPLSTDVFTRAKWTIDTNHSAGLVVSADSRSNPLNYVIAYHNHTNLFLVKYINNVPTELINTAVTYINNASIDIRKSGTTYQLYYNDVQIGTDQTITDPEIINNRIHGLFSTSSLNSCSMFTTCDINLLTLLPTVFLGTSITYGYYASDYSTTSFRALVATWLRNQVYTSATITNSGVPSASSFTKLTDLDTSTLTITPSPVLIILDNEPNDDLTFHHYCAEAVIRRIFTTLPTVKIYGVLFGRVADHTVDDPTNTMATTETINTALFNHYGIPYTSFSNEVANNVPSVHSLSWYYPTDEVHPGDNGHAVAAGLVENLISTSSPIIPNPLPARYYADTEDYENLPGFISGSSYTSRTGTWTDSGSSIISTDTATPATVTYTFTGRAIGIDDSYTSNPSVSYQVDGGSWSTNWLTMRGREMSSVRSSHTICIKVLSGSVKITKVWYV